MKIEPHQPQAVAAQAVPTNLVTEYGTFDYTQDLEEFQKQCQPYRDDDTFRVETGAILQPGGRAMVLRKEKKAVGGFSFYEQEGGWVELSTLWGRGYGKELSHYWKKEFEQRGYIGLYALTVRSKLIPVFEGYGLTCIGNHNALVEHNDHPDLPPSLQDYPDPIRDPYVCILKKSTSPLRAGVDVV